MREERVREERGCVFANCSAVLALRLTPAERAGLGCSSSSSESSQLSSLQPAAAIRHSAAKAVQNPRADSSSPTFAVVRRLPSLCAPVRLLEALVCG